MANKARATPVFGYNLSRHPCDMHAVFGGHLALRSVRSSHIARCRDAFRSSPVCHRCRSACDRPGSPLPGPDVCHPHMQDSLRSSALFEPDVRDLHSSLSPLGPLKELCQHTCLEHSYCALGPKPSAGKILPSRHHVLKGMQECCPPSVAKSCKFSSTLA